MQVENTKTLLLPDRGGNNRLDGLSNLLHNPAVGLLFLIPGWSKCFRLNGQAQISVVPALRALCPKRRAREERAGWERSEFCVTVKLLQRNHIIQPPVKIDG